MREVIAIDHHGDVFESLIEKGEIEYNIDPDPDTLSQWVKMILGMLKNSGFNDIKMGNVAVLYGDDQEGRSNPTLSFKVNDGGFFTYVMIDNVAQQYMIVEDEGHHKSIPPSQFTVMCIKRQYDVSVDIIENEAEVEADQARKEQDRLDATSKYRAQGN